jgi:hypothetical protein
MRYRIVRVVAGVGAVAGAYVLGALAWLVGTTPDARAVLVWGGLFPVVAVVECLFVWAILWGVAPEAAPERRYYPTSEEALQARKPGERVYYAAAKGWYRETPPKRRWDDIF